MRQAGVLQRGELVEAGGDEDRARENRVGRSHRAVEQRRARAAGPCSAVEQRARRRATPRRSPAISTERRGCRLALARRGLGEIRIGRGSSAPAVGSIMASTIAHHIAKVSRAAAMPAACRAEIGWHMRAEKPTIAVRQAPGRDSSSRTRPAPQCSRARSAADAQARAGYGGRAGSVCGTVDMARS